jgi:hypothetical protein
MTASDRTECGSVSGGAERPANSLLTEMGLAVSFGIVVAAFVMAMRFPTRVLPLSRRVRSS